MLRRQWCTLCKHYYFFNSWYIPHVTSGWGWSPKEPLPCLTIKCVSSMRVGWGCSLLSAALCTQYTHPAYFLFNKAAQGLDSI